MGDMSDIWLSEASSAYVQYVVSGMFLIGQISPDLQSRAAGQTTDIH